MQVIADVDDPADLIGLLFDLLAGLIAPAGRNELGVVALLQLYLVGGHVGRLHYHEPEVARVLTQQDGVYTLLYQRLLAHPIGVVRLAVLILVGLDGLDHQEAEAGLLEEGLVVQHNVVPELVLLEDLAEVVDVVEMEPEDAVLMEGVVILDSKLHEREKQQFD